MNIGNTSCIELWDIDKARGDKGDSNQQIKRESSQTYTRSVESGGQNDTGDLRNNGFAQEDSTKENIFKDARKDYEKFTPKENITNEQSFGENGRFESRDGQNGEYLKRSGSNARDDRQNKQGVERSERKSQNTQSRTNERTDEEIKEFSNISSRNKPVITESQTITRAREYQQRVSTLLQSQFANGIIQRTLEALRSAKREQNPRESTNRLEKKATQNYHTNPRFNGGEARSAFRNEEQGGELESTRGESGLFQQLDRNNIQPDGEQQRGKREFASESREISTSKTDRGPYRNNNAGDKRGDYATTRDDGQQSNEFSSSQVKQAGKQNSETNPTSKDEFADKLSDSKDISDLPSNETIQKEFNQANIPQELKRTNNAIFNTNSSKSQNSNNNNGAEREAREEMGSADQQVKQDLEFNLFADDREQTLHKQDINKQEILQDAQSGGVRESQAEDRNNGPREFEIDSRFLQEQGSNRFRVFTEYEFLKRYEQEGFKGQYDFKFSKKQRIEANLKALRLTQVLFMRMELLKAKDEINQVAIEKKFQHLNITKEELNLKEFQNFSFSTLAIKEEEQALLAQYSGFGGLRDLFFNEEFKELENELKDLIGEMYYKEIRESSFNAYYTPKDVIESIYLGLQNLGVPKDKRILALEPSCGTGRFIALAPSNYEFQAVEKDTLSATIAKFLHPQVRIYNQGLEEVKFNNEFDVIVGNPPFDNQVKIRDYSSLGNNKSIHNYFAIKSSELVKDNGIVSFVITSYFLDSERNAHREILHKKGDFLSAYRLPNAVFRESNTNVLTDVYFYQKLSKDGLERRKKAFKKEESLKQKQIAFVKTALFAELVSVNSHFNKNVKHILGEFEIRENTRYGQENIKYEMLVKDNGNWSETLKKQLGDLIPVFKDNAPFEKELNLINFSLLSTEEAIKVNSLGVGNLFFMDNKIYVKGEYSSCEEAYFSDSLDISKMDLVPKAHILKIDKKNFQYKSFLNRDEVQIAKKIIDFRDLLNENLKNEKHYLDDEESNAIILKQKERLRELRSEILHLANIKSFHQNNRNKTDKQGIVLQHNLQNILNLDKLTRFSILATETKNDKGNYELSPILKMRAYKPLQKSLANSNEEALQKTINEKGFIDEKTLQDYKPNTPLNEILQVYARNN